MNEIEQSVIGRLYYRADLLENLLYHDDTALSVKADIRSMKKDIITLINKITVFATAKNKNLDVDSEKFIRKKLAYLLLKARQYLKQ